MKNIGLARLSAVIAALAMILLAFAGCAGGNGTGAAGGNGAEVVEVVASDTSGGVAASVNGVEIGENAVTAYINNFRHAQGLQDDNDWGQWIYDAGYSMEALRSDTIEFFVSQELVRQAAEQEGVTVTDAEVDAKIAEARGEGTDEEYAQALDQQGMTESFYRESVRVSLLQEKLSDKVLGDNEVDEAQLLEYLKMYYPNEVDEKATSLEGIDEDRIETVRNILKTLNDNQGFSDWMADFRSKAEIVKNSMPEGLPYVVDLTPYMEAANAAQAASSDAASAGQGSSGGSSSEPSASASSASEEASN